MYTENAIKPMTLDELAAAKLAAGLIAAIDAITVEQIIWSRRQTMQVSDVMPPMIWSSGNVRILPLCLGFGPGTLELRRCLVA